MNEQRRLRVVVVGAGGWGRQHTRVFSQRPDVDLLAVCSRSAERAAGRAAEFGIRPYTDAGAMIEAERPDLVSVCLPNQRHFEATLRLIETGLPLLVEKPLVFTMAEADALIEAAARRCPFFAINFNHRYAVPVRMARECALDGRLGTLVLATWRFGGDGRQAHPYANLIETQCHGFDMLEHLAGPVAAVSAEMSGVSGNALSTVVVGLRFASGAVGSLVGSYDTSYAYPGAHRLELVGTRGRVLVEDTVKRFTYHPDHSETGSVWEAGYFNDRDRDFHRTFDAHVDALLAALRGGQPPPVHARAGRRALRLALAAAEAHETGRRVEVDATDGPEPPKEVPV